MFDGPDRHDFWEEDFDEELRQSDLDAARGCLVLVLIGAASILTLLFYFLWSILS